MTKLSCFKAYDIRGQVPNDLNEGIAYKIGVAYAQEFPCKGVVVGYDARLESPSLSASLMNGLTDAGIDVIDIGLCGTEEVYFHTFFKEADGVGGGIMITASHNPKGYNGMKLVQKGSRPISGDSGLFALHDRVVNFQFTKADVKGRYLKQDDKKDYIQHLLSYVKVDSLKKLKIVVNPGNGTAGLVIKELKKYLPFDFISIHDDIDGTFPNGVPNPLLPDNRQSTVDAVLEHKADFGIAWDGDFDRCFFFDEAGRFIEGYYIVGLLAEAFLQKHRNEKIIHDPRLTWNTIDCVSSAGGIPVQSKTGHAFIKERMRQENAIYGGEMSAHHYFRDFAYCDSGMIPWLLVAELMSAKNIKLSSMVDERMQAYPCSGELNYKVLDAKVVIEKIYEVFAKENPIIDQTDGLSMDFGTWRFNIRSSNTEPLLRLNVETKGDPDLVLSMVKKLEGFIS